MREIQKKTPKIKKNKHGKNTKEAKAPTFIKTFKSSKKIKKNYDKTKNNEKISSLYEKAQNIYQEKVAFYCYNNIKIIVRRKNIWIAIIFQKLIKHG